MVTLSPSGLSQPPKWGEGAPGSGSWTHESAKGKENVAHWGTVSLAVGEALGGGVQAMSGNPRFLRDLGLDPQATGVCKSFFPFHRVGCPATLLTVSSGDRDLKGSCDSVRSALIISLLSSELTWDTHLQNPHSSV